MTEATKNRELMPNAAALIDEMRQTLGVSFKVVYVKDAVTGFEAGQSPDLIDPDKVFNVPPNYYPSEPFETKKGKRK